ncbi:secreted protein [Bathymodiolus azoricus thioautotrophic gill symbiont]|uniref:Secreted protein n=1 Tax=Bathymodiolus azoricus thioautotrophic gill symbiont TaxID=235205 RepID=A0A1H6JN46_9GAMM|nr:secreted protein [Bathymodiolus azoricus thioautotrophic gill symbiont]
MIKKITITLLAFSLASCFSFGEKAKKQKAVLVKEIFNTMQIKQ